MASGKTARKSGNQYDCSKCPGYCCSYPLIEVGKRDIQRLAKHFGISYAQAETRYTRFDKSEKVRSLRQQEDEHFGRICKLFDTKKRQCTVYESRPGVCRDYPEGKRCGYYEFLQFEREHQDDPTFVATT
ncbi:MAG: YkgJ family cysteine cluster protein [Betaproteobacteria bacterium]|nr:MAG: YkgJ family cysteine cluster protein [Betaproteobacteria bacterium]